MELGKDKTALIVVDMQNGFLSHDGSMAKLGFDVDRLIAAIPGCERLVAAARASDVPVIYTQYVYQADFKDAGVMVDDIFPAIRDVKLCADGTWDAEIIDSLKPDANDAVVKKNRPSGFYSTSLESFLRAMRIDSLVVCGVTTNMCVESTVRDAAQRDYRTFVVSDATGEVEQDRYDVALKAMGYMFARIMTVNEVFDSWGVELSNVA